MPTKAFSPIGSIQRLSQKAQTCLAQAVDVPGDPLYNKKNIAIFDSKSSFDLLQATINYLTCKAQVKMRFSKEEKEFLIELYEVSWSHSGPEKMSEEAKLADHYIYGRGGSIAVNPKPYQLSLIVKDTTEAMRLYIKSLARWRKDFYILKTNNLKLRQSRYFKPLIILNGNRDIQTQGCIEDSGMLIVETLNKQLHKTSRCFFLQANTKKTTKKTFETTWSIKTRYDFEPFNKGNYATEILFKKGKKLLLPDGLSEYMNSGLSIATPFNYEARWSETWK